MPVNNFRYFNKRIHFIGAMGISMSALAKISFYLGAKVSASDDNKIDPTLFPSQINAYTGRVIKNATEADLVVYSFAIPSNHDELTAAKCAGVTVFDRAQYLSYICSLFDCVTAIAGSHGKTTVTCNVTELLYAFGIDLTALIGGISNRFGSNLLYGSDDALVVEACEYKRAFLQLNPDIAIITNVDYDHPDCYNSPEEYQKAFISFSQKVKNTLICPLSLTEIINCTSAQQVFAVTNADCNIAEIRYFYEDIKKSNVNVVSYAIFTDKSQTEVQTYINGKEYFSFLLPPSTEAEIEDVIFASIAAEEYGVDERTLKIVAPTLSGAKRRMEKIPFASGIVYKDYAHHPTEIMQAIKKLKLQFPDKKIVVAFEPHTYSRTKALLNEFSNCFKMAIRVAILPTFSARETLSDGIDAKTLFDSILHPDKTYLSNYKALKKFVRDNANEQNVVVLLGAGSIGNALN